MWRLASLRAHPGVQAPVSTQFDGPVTASGAGNVRLGEQCRLGRDVHFDTADAGQIILGDRVRINAGGVIVATRSVTIGDDTLVGEYVSIRDADHGTAIGASPIRSQPLVEAEIRIGRDVWIGRGCCILKGVCIGDGAVVGANSVVTSDVPPNSVYAGAPAKQIGSRRA
jgi:acetyltransferase-like isoleucine patch superfamily enzyme